MIKIPVTHSTYEYTGSTLLATEYNAPHHLRSKCTITGSDAALILKAPLTSDIVSHKGVLGAINVFEFRIADEGLYIRTADESNVLQSRILIQAQAPLPVIRFYENLRTRGIYPEQVDVYDLGTASAEWKNLYIGTGKIYFGIGQDVNLYRYTEPTAGAMLATDNPIISKHDTDNLIALITNTLNPDYSAIAVKYHISGDLYSYFWSVNKDGAIEWGAWDTPGTRDVNLYRAGANTLKTNDNFYAVGNILTDGNVDGVDLAGFKVAYDVHDHGDLGPTGINHSDLTNVTSSQHHVKTVAGDLNLADLNEKSHNSLTNVTTSQHHVKTVASELNLADMNEKSHVSLTNVTASQHHTKTTSADINIQDAGDVDKVSIADDKILVYNGDLGKHLYEAKPTGGDPVSAPSPCTDYQPIIARMGNRILVYYQAPYFIVDAHHEDINQYGSWLTLKQWGWGQIQWVGKIEECDHGVEYMGLEYQHGRANNGIICFHRSDGIYYVKTSWNGSATDTQLYGQDWTSEATFEIQWEYPNIVHFLRGGETLTTHTTNVPPDSMNFFCEAACLSGVTTDAKVYLKSGSLRKL